MAMKCCKLDTAKERCPIVFQGHPSNFKVTRYKTSPILTQIGRFRTIGRSQLSNPSDLPCYQINKISLTYVLLFQDSWANTKQRTNLITEKISQDFDWREWLEGLELPPVNQMCLNEMNPGTPIAGGVLRQGKDLPPAPNLGIWHPSYR